MLKAGICIMDVTPPVGYRMRGFSGRKAAQGVHDPLHVKIMTVADGKNRVALVTADFADYSPALVEKIKQHVKEQTGLPEGNLLLTASHTHSGPFLTPPTGAENAENKVIPGYAEVLIRKVAGGVLEAILREEQVTAWWATSSLDIGIVNRRKRERGVVVMKPNPAGPVDHQVATLIFKRPGGAPKAIIFNYCCHPTTLGLIGSDDPCEITADYPGAAQRELERMYSGAAAMFINGCSGDLMPNITKNGEFFGGSFADVERMGRLLSAQAAINCERATQLPGNKVSGQITRLNLPFDKGLIPKTARDVDRALAAYARLMPEFTDTCIKTWGNAIRARINSGEQLPRSIPACVQCLNIAGAKLLGLPGEIMVEIGLALKRRAAPAPLIVAGCANGSIGYLPTAAGIVAGGYEGMSFIFNDYPASFAMSLERRLIGAALSLVRSGK